MSIVGPWIVRGLLLLSTAAGLGSAPERSEPPAVEEPAAVLVGMVMDEHGQPVGGAQVSNLWVVPSPPGRPSPHDDPQAGAVAAKADASGRFALDLRHGRTPAALFAMDPERRRGGLLVLDEATPVQITVRPLVRVHGRCASTELSWLPRNIGGAVVHASGRQFIDWRVDPDTGAFELPLPPGDYRLYAMSDDAQTWKKDITIPAGAAEVDIGVVDMRASIIARHYGQGPPPAWKVTAARGVERSVKLSDYRGRWVLLEFWGFW